MPLVLVGLGTAFWRRRRSAREASEPWEDAAPVETPVASPLPKAAPPPAPVPPPPPVPATIDCAFEPVAMRLSLVYATLQFRIALTAGEAHGGGRLAGDMISAHASLSQDEQLAPTLETLATIATCPAMAAGQTVVLTGEIRLPLAAIRPLERGGATYLVPLVRVVLLVDDTAPLRRVFTIGTIGTGPALAPIRLDTGPRMVGDLQAREIEAARALPAASIPRRAAG